MYDIVEINGYKFVYKDGKSIVSRFQLVKASGMKNIIEESFGKDFYYFKNEVTEGLVQNLNQFIKNKLGLSCFLLDSNFQLIPACIEYANYEQQGNELARVDYKVSFPIGGSDKEIISSGFGFYSLEEIKKAEQEAVVSDLNKFEVINFESDVKIKFVKEIFKGIDFSKQETKTGSMN